MTNISRREVLTAAVLIPISGCMSSDDEDEISEKPTASETEVSPPVQRNLEIRNELSEELPVSIRVIEYSDGFEGDGYGKESSIQTVTDTPTHGGGNVVHESETTVSANGRAVVDSVLTLYDSPRKYYIEMEAGDEVSANFSFISQFGVGFRYLSLVLDGVPDLHIVTD